MIRPMITIVAITITEPAAYKEFYFFDEPGCNIKDYMFRDNVSFKKNKIRCYNIAQCI